MARRREDVSVKNNDEDYELNSLVEKAIRGDRDSLIGLCQAIAKSVLFRVQCYLHNPMDSEDTAQEVLIRVCENIYKLRDPRAFRSWLNTMIVNETRRYASKNSKQGSVVYLDEYLNDNDFEEDDDEFLPEEYTFREEDRRIIMDIIHDLPEQQRLAIVMHYYDHMGIMEIARATNVSHQNVSRNLKLAKDKIKNELEKLSKKTGTLYSIAMLPIGGILAGLFNQEATVTSFASTSLLEGAITNGTVHTSKFSSILAGIKVALGSMLQPTIAIVSVAVVTTGFVIGSNLIKKPKNEQPQTSQNITVEGRIDFSGGNILVEHMNPKKAIVVASNENGELRAIGWSIKAIEDEREIYSGKGNTIDDLLTKMQENGSYILSFEMQDKLGNKYLITREFIIIN